MNFEEGLDLYLDLLLKWNRAVRLTGYTSKGEIRRNGIEPSLEAADLLPNRAAVLDVGSGGGIPAVPLALARPDVRWTLSEPSSRKAAFLRETSKLLSLDFDVRSVPVETLLAGVDGPWEVVTLRALKLRKGLLRSLRGALKPGGFILFWTGGDAAERYEAWMGQLGMAPSTFSAKGMTLLRGVRE
jgi:16S rRNA (guanine527-N7)-methyltransferase